MTDNLTTSKRAALIAVNTGTYPVEQSLLELEELAKTDDILVQAVFSQKRETYDRATFVGSGRLNEIANYCKENEMDLLIFDDELTATQMRNIENLTEIPVVDRTMLILDIFAQRAQSAEGRLQVELAQLRYRLPRLSGIGIKLSRLGGGIGTRGPGETKLETDRRHIRRRIKTLEKELEALEKRRKRRKLRRKKDNITSIAIVGYTNAGKSTLLNALTNAGVLSENKLFVTLDPTARTLTLPSGRSVLMIDTVGLISRLPHHLVEAFKSTLEEAQNADLLLHICDVSNANVDNQVKITDKILEDLGCASIPTLHILNKSDKISYRPLIFDKNSIMISAKTGFGFDNMLKRIDETLESSSKRMKLLIPYHESGFTSKIRVDGKVFSEEYMDDGILVDALVNNRLLTQVQSFIKN